MTPRAASDATTDRMPVDQKTECPKLDRQAIFDGRRLIVEVASMMALAGVWKRKRDDLKDRRFPLFKRYEKCPNDLRLALEIKSIDDQIAECTQEIARENRKLEPGLGP